MHLHRQGNLIVILLAASMAPALAAPPPTPLYREFSDWVVSCDNARTCTAKALADPDADRGDTETPSVYLSVVRPAGPAGTPTLTFVAEQPGASPASVTLDGRTLNVALRWGTAAGDSDTARLSGSAALALLREMAGGEALTVATPTRAQRFSLRGLSASLLLLLDDVQGRLGTVTALVRTGDAPARAVPPAPALPVVRAAPPPPALRNAQAFAATVRKSQAAVLKSHECQPDNGEMDEAKPLTAGEAIVTLICWRAAYQEATLVFRAPRASPAGARLVRLPPPPALARPRDPADADFLTGVSYDPTRAVLSDSAKGRGLAECGSSTQWTFGGRAFHLSEYAFQGRCVGMPGDWPVVFRTRRGG